MTGNDELKEKITALLNENDRLRDKIHKNSHEIARLAGLRFNVRVGDRVLCKGREFVVTAVISMANKPWLKGNPIKKDGTRSLAERHLYSDWELVK